MSYPAVEGTPTYYLDWQLVLIALAVFWFLTGIIATVLYQKINRFWRLNHAR